MKGESITEYSNARRPNERSTSTASTSTASTGNTSTNNSSGSSTYVRAGSSNVQAVTEPSSSSTYVRAGSSSNVEAEPVVATDKSCSRNHAGCSSDIYEQGNMHNNQPTESTCDAAVILSSISNEVNAPSSSAKVAVDAVSVSSSSSRAVNEEVLVDESENIIQEAKVVSGTPVADVLISGTASPPIVGEKAELPVGEEEDKTGREQMDSVEAVKEVVEEVVEKAAADRNIGENEASEGVAVENKIVYEENNEVGNKIDNGEEARSINKDVEVSDNGIQGDIENGTAVDVPIAIEASEEKGIEVQASIAAPSSSKESEVQAAPSSSKKSDAKRKLLSFQNSDSKTNGDGPWCSEKLMENKKKKKESPSEVSTSTLPPSFIGGGVDSSSSSSPTPKHKSLPVPAVSVSSSSSRESTSVSTSTLPHGNIIKPNKNKRFIDKNGTIHPKKGDEIRVLYDEKDWYAGFVHDFDSDKQIVTVTFEEGETETREFPDEDILVLFADLGTTQRNGGRPMNPKVSKNDVTMKSLKKDLSDIIGLQYAEMYFVSKVLCEYWCTVIDLKVIKGKEICTCQWSDGSKTKVPLKKVIDSINQNRANERRGKNGGAFVTTESDLINTDISTKTPSSTSKRNSGHSKRSKIQEQSSSINESLHVNNNFEEGFKVHRTSNEEKAMDNSEEGFEAHGTSNEDKGRGSASSFSPTARPAGTSIEDKEMGSVSPSIIKIKSHTSTSSETSPKKKGGRQNDKINTPSRSSQISSNEDKEMSSDLGINSAVSHIIDKNLNTDDNSKEERVSELGGNEEGEHTSDINIVAEGLSKVLKRFIEKPIIARTGLSAKNGPGARGGSTAGGSGPGARSGPGAKGGPGARGGPIAGGSGPGARGGRGAKDVCVQENQGNIPLKELEVIYQDIPLGNNVKVKKSKSSAIVSNGNSVVGENVRGSAESGDSHLSKASRKSTKGQSLSLGLIIDKEPKEDVCVQEDQGCITLKELEKAIVDGTSDASTLDNQINQSDHHDKDAAMTAPSSQNKNAAISPSSQSKEISGPSLKSKIGMSGHPEPHMGKTHKSKSESKVQGSNTEGEGASGLKLAESSIGNKRKLKSAMQRPGTQEESKRTFSASGVKLADSRIIDTDSNDISEDQNRVETYAKQGKMDSTSGIAGVDGVQDNQATDVPLEDLEVVDGNTAPPLVASLIGSSTISRPLSQHEFLKARILELECEISRSVTDNSESLFAKKKRSLSKRELFLIARIQQLELDTLMQCVSSMPSLLTDSSDAHCEKEKDPNDTPRKGNKSKGEGDIKKQEKLLKVIKSLQIQR
eukprot:CAMPEP_0119035352 /NCGR_PEP_ID=MMETSP1177-20130426/2271_1 /TAXON_ID=2985 /ORGANISM="Ochromonas sp, Strain CCMP1899" /LENGTH=1309 /DNA_ID=CAMNT_0006993421 /DNA_START=759 /DNA_END=4688 /DNA_ORIENTATION=+